MYVSILKLCNVTESSNALNSCLCNNSGSTYHLLKQFVQYNYVLNVQSNTSPRTVWPLVAFMSDSIVMWKKLHPSGRFVT